MYISFNFVSAQCIKNIFFFSKNILDQKVYVMVPIYIAGSTEIMPLVEADLKRSAEKVLDKARELCKKKSVRN